MFYREIFVGCKYIRKWGSVKDRWVPIEEREGTRREKEDIEIKESRYGNTSEIRIFWYSNLARCNWRFYISNFFKLFGSRPQISNYYSLLLIPLLQLFRAIL